MTSEINPRTIIPLKQFVLWVVLSALVVFVVSLMSAQLPPEVKKLVIFHAVLGLGLGVCLRKLGVEFDCLHSRRVAPYGFVLIILGCLQLAGISYQQFYNHQQSIARQNPKQLATLNMLEENFSDSPEYALKYQQARREFEPHFYDYLKMRTSSLGDWSRPWPIVLWVIEVLIAASSGGWILSRKTSSTHNT